MQMGLKIALSLFGLLFLYMGAGFLLNPAEAGVDFGIGAAGEHGLTSIRADLTAFFLVAGGTTLLGAWTAKKEYLYVAAALMGIALVTRIISAAQFGTFDGWLTPIVVEAVTAVLALMAVRVLPGSGAPVAG